MTSETGPKISRRNALTSAFAGLGLGLIGSQSLAKPKRYKKTKSIKGIAPVSAEARLRATDALKSAMDTYVASQLKARPQLCSQLGLDVGGLRAQKSALDPCGQQQSKVFGLHSAQLVAALKNIRSADLDTFDGLIYQSLLHLHQDLVSDYSQFEFGTRLSPYSVSPYHASAFEIPVFLDACHGIDTRDDAQAYLLRLSEMAGLIEQETKAIKSEAEQGVILPNFLIESSVRHLRQWHAQKASKNALVTYLNQKTIDKAFYGDWLSRATLVVEGMIYPALRQQIEILESLLTSVNSEPSFSFGPQYEAFYAMAIKRHAVMIDQVSQPSAQGLHHWGLEQVGQISETLASQFAYSDKDGLADKRLSKDELAQAFQQEQDALIRRIPEFFANYSTQGIELRPNLYNQILDDQDPNYCPQSLDGRRKAIVYGGTAALSQADLALFTMQFGFPGTLQWQSHLYANQNLPIIFKIADHDPMGAGWASYIEHFAYETGVFEDRPSVRILILRRALKAAVRLVVDTGIHGLKWTYPQAQAYVKSNLALNDDQALVEIEKICVAPGAAIAPITAKHAWLKLRERIKAKNPSTFDLKSFHNVGLGVGPLGAQAIWQTLDKGLVALGESQS